MPWQCRYGGCLHVNDGNVVDARAAGEACEECDCQPDSEDEYDERLDATDDRNPAVRAELHRDRQHRLHAKGMGNEWLPPNHFCATNCNLCHWSRHLRNCWARGVMSPRPRDEEKQAWADKRVHPQRWTDEEFFRYRFSHPALSGEPIRGNDDDVSWMGDRREQELIQESAYVDAAPCYPTPDAGPPTHLHTDHNTRTSWHMHGVSHLQFSSGATWDSSSGLDINASCLQHHPR
jgi:hypothetical protein